MTASRVTTAYLAKSCAVLDKAAAICEILNVWITGRLIRQVWLAGKHLIHNLQTVKSGWLENTSSITSKQSFSGVRD
jgi:hypothetical protein